MSAAHAVTRQLCVPLTLQKSNVLDHRLARQPLSQIWLVCCELMQRLPWHTIHMWNKSAGLLVRTDLESNGQ